MKKTTIGMVLLCAILLGSCTKEAEMKNEALPQNTETTMDAFKPMTFEQTRALVGEVLGSDVAERIEPTSRYVRVFFPNVDRLLEEIRKEGLIYSSLPAPGIEITPVTVQEGRPEPVYTVLEGDAQLPDDVEYEVLAEFFAPGDPQSGLTPDEALTVEAAMNTTTRVATNWKPSGRVEYRDELTGEDYPIEGLRVVIFGYSSSMQMIQETVRTDTDGNFTATKTYAALPGTASIQWQDIKWSILSNSSSLASTGQVIDPNTMPRWNCIISSTKSVSYDYATAHLAAKYMNKNGYSVTGGTVQICCLDEAVPSGSDDRFLPDPYDATVMKVLVYCQDKTPLDIMATVLREMGKAVQWLKINAKNNDYIHYSRVITESWGEFTKWYFLDEYYKELDALYKLHVYDDLYSPWYPKPDDLNIQLWYYNPTKSPYDQCRTPMFIDLWDNCNQSELDENITTATAKYPVDAVNLKVNADISDLAAWSVSCKKVEAVEALSISTVPEQSNNIRTLMTLYKELESTL